MLIICNSIGVVQFLLSSKVQFFRLIFVYLILYLNLFLLLFLPAEGGLPRSSNSKQQQASSKQQAKVYVCVCVYVYVREYELRSRNLIGGGPVLTGREWQA